MKTRQEECFEIFGVNETTLVEPAIGLRAISISLLMCSSLVFIFSFGYFLKYRREFDFLEKRSTTLLGYITFGFILLSIHCCLLSIAGTQYSCHIFSLLPGCASFILTTAYFLYVFSYFWRVSFSEALLEDKFKNFVKEHDTTVFSSPTTGRDNNSVAENSTRSPRCLKLKFCLMATLRWKQNEHVPSHLNFDHFLATKETVTKLFYLTQLLILPTYVAYHFLFRLPYDLECFGCDTLYRDYSFPAVLGFALPTFYILYKMRKYPDSLGVKQGIFVFASLTVILHMIFEAIRFIFLRELEEKGYFNFYLVFPVEYMLVALYFLPYQIIQARRNANRSLDDCKVSLDEFLQSEKGTKAFLLYLASSLCAEMLLFYKAVEYWKLQYDNNDQAENIYRAYDIYNTFIAANATFRVNVSWQVEERIKIELERGVTVAIFDQAQVKVYNLMNDDLFRNFYLSSYYSTFENNIDGAEVVGLNKLL